MSSYRDHTHTHSADRLLSLVAVCVCLLSRSNNRGLPRVFRHKGEQVEQVVSYSFRSPPKLISRCLSFSADERRSLMLDQ